MKNARPCPQSALLAASLLVPFACQTDEQLITLSLEGQTKAFGELFERYHKQFVRVARRIVHSEAEAQDVTQNAFVNMFTKLHTFQQGSCYRSWAYRVVVNTALMSLRKRRHRREISDDVVTPLSAGSSILSSTPGMLPDERIALNQLGVTLEGAIATLEPKYREVFVMREAGDLSVKEISEATGLSVPAVKSRLHRARLFLRATLERDILTVSPIELSTVAC